jgi:hypothetical protein
MPHETCSSTVRNFRFQFLQLRLFVLISNNRRPYRLLRRVYRGECGARHKYRRFMFHSERNSHNPRTACPAYLPPGPSMPVEPPPGPFLRSQSLPATVMIGSPHEKRFVDLIRLFLWLIRPMRTSSFLVIDAQGLVSLVRFLISCST